MAEAKAEQERLMAEVVAEAMTEAKDAEEKLIAGARVEQLLKQDQLMAEIDASQANNEELCKANEELCKNLQQLDQRTIAERGPSTQPRAHPKPFSQAIMDSIVPANYITPKIVQEIKLSPIEKQHS